MGNWLGSAVDWTIGAFSARTAFERARFRKATEILMLSAYKAGSTDRLKGDWLGTGGSPDADFLPEQARIRNRSRDLNRNNGIASGITSTVVGNVVGAGIHPQSTLDIEALEIDQEAADALQDEMEAVWDEWCNWADAGNRMHFQEIEELVIRQILENGEALVYPRLVKREGQTRLALQMIESDRLDTPYDLMKDMEVRGGVRVGKYGEPVGYYVLRNHPGDTIRSKLYYKIEDFEYIPSITTEGWPGLFHLYHVLRPDQSRGVPFFAPVMDYFKHHGDYMEAELVAARIAACFGLVVKALDPTGSAAAHGSLTNATGQRIESIEPGMVRYMSAGEDISQITPMRPGDNFDAFVRRILRQISAALNMPYELVAMDFEKVNYSSARCALLEARRFFQTRQQWLIEKFCKPVWRMVMEMAFLERRLSIDDFYAKSRFYTASTWIAPGWKWVDPQKEGAAIELALKGNLTTLAKEAAEQGLDWEEILKQRAREQARIKELGLETLEEKAMVAEQQAQEEADDEPSASEEQTGSSADS